MYTINLNSVPAEVFTALVRKSASQDCKIKDPDWVEDAVNNGVQLTLQNVLIQAGRHFSDCVNPATFVGARRRQAATALAWMICAMVEPSVSSNRLLVEDPRDPDVKRLCSEIFGVGLALEVLRKSSVIDARTLQKLSARFDFHAKGPNGTGLVRIEAKGTFNNVKGSAHRASVREKIAAQGTARNYNRNVGVIAALWTKDKQGGFDLELCDPEGKPRDHFEEAVREVIRFYAFRFDESVGNEEGVKSLLAIADDPALFGKEEPRSLLALGPADSPSRRFWRSRVVLRQKNQSRVFLGAFWEPRKLPIPLELSDNRPEGVVAFMGVDAEILRLIRARDFRAVLAYTTEEATLLKAEASENFDAVFQLDVYGIVRGLTRGELPENVEVK
jgi:hypothetical protein